MGAAGDAGAACAGGAGLRMGDMAGPASVPPNPAGGGGGGGGGGARAPGATPARGEADAHIGADMTGDGGAAEGAEDREGKSSSDRSEEHCTGGAMTRLFANICNDTCDRDDG